MATKFSAEVRAWTEKAKRNSGLVLADAAQSVFFDMSQRQPSVKDTGGTFELGKVPVDTGVLINTMFSELNGVRTAEGSNAYIAALGGFKLGDVISHNFSASYAAAIEYGTQHFEGRFMVREAINGDGGWQARVDAAAAKFRD